MKGYKGMNSDMTCRGMKFEVGKSYHVDGKIKLCENGLHFCEKLVNVFNFYKRDNSNRFFEVETNVEAKTDGTKFVTSDLTIVRELDTIEVNRVYYGNGYGDGDGNGDGYGNGNGNGYGYGNGNGNGYGNGNGNGNGNGYGYGYGDGNGDGYGNGNGNGDGNGYGDGYGYGDGIQKILAFK